MFEILISAGAVKLYPHTGPGPIELIAGNEEAGFFGEVSASELFTTDELSSRFSTLKNTSNSKPSNPTWLKFFYKSKVLFIAKDLRFGPLSWNDLYNAGLIYGTDDNGVDSSGFEINQLSLISKGPYSFIVRTISGMQTNPIDHPEGKELEVYSSEWTDLIYGVVQGAILTYPTSQLGSYTPNQLGITNITDPVQETDGDQISYARGISGGRIDYIARYNKATHKLFQYRPVLELRPKDAPLMRVLHERFSIQAIQAPEAIEVLTSYDSQDSGEMLYRATDIRVSTQLLSNPETISASFENGLMRPANYRIATNFLYGPEAINIEKNIEFT